MTPAARLAASIEILGGVLGSNQAADRLLLDWQRKNRYAGAKDRRAIAEAVYTALREQGMRRWRLQQAEAPLTPRLFAMADPAISPEQWQALCDNSKYAPPRLSDDEIAALQRLPANDAAPLWARVNLPPELTALCEARFGTEAEAELEALNGRAPLDLRVNTLKTNREEMLRQLQAEGIEAAPTRLSPLGIRLQQQVRLEQHPLYLDGLIEPQDEAAQVAALLLGARPGETVIDLCAGAGGKTLALAAQMKNRGRLVAADHDFRRLNRLKPRLARAGIGIVETAAAEKLPALLEAMEGQADRVFLDVPCSGSGTWRRNPETRWRFGPAALDDLQAAQRGLLAQGVRLLKPGGRLVYATCSILPPENDAPVDDILAHGEVTPIPLAQAWEEGLSTACPLAGDRLALTPLRHGTDGFFAAVLQRRG
ncbi:RsmB/NOP family class I SAM-dependent RNA methyltransferase [Ferrovibrio sp.]|uniref:RsmB/NOP family class I SAM-dependent RNA methyltransferase n=1 Tax=Ferrovibrio sp. TaxID=1917215 RepID=UPI003D2E1055